MTRLLQTLRYYRKSSMVRRMWKIAVAERFDRWRARPARAPLSIDADFLNRLRHIAELRIPRGETTLNDLRSGRLTLLSETIDVGHPIRWETITDTSVPRLWAFHLHYQEYLWDIARRDNTDSQLLWQVVMSWIIDNRPPQGRRKNDAWHPYCISRRLPVWLALWSLSPPPTSNQQLILASLTHQTDYLLRHLELDLGGNHLLENFRAAAWGLLALQYRRPPMNAKIDDESPTPFPATCLTNLVQRLRDQRKEQLLSHGEHFELTPAYHLLVLGNWLQLAHLAEETAPELYRECVRWCEPMFDFLTEMVHPDDEIPLLADSGFGEVYPVREVRKLASLVGLPNQGAASNRATVPGVTIRGDYWIYRQDDNFLLFDAGPVGADYLPAHAHADLLTLEASIAGQRWIVDSGLYNYEADAMRSYCRSSVAHNVLTVDDVDQCDMWSRFRMGYRGRSSRLQSGSDNGTYWARASHDGYRRLGVPCVERTVEVSASGTWQCTDQFETKSRHRFTTRLHLAPEIEIEEIHPGVYRLTCGNTTRQLTFFGATEHRQEEAWYCPGYGKRIRNKRLLAEVDTDKNGKIGWRIEGT